MNIIKCKMCGGDIELSADKTFGFCEYCGSGMTLPRVDSEQRAAAFNRGNHFRRIGEFDKALAVYEKIVSENEQDAEAHWCCALCRFGIEYVEDPNTMEWFPTCHRASFDSFLEDVDYKAAVAYSTGVTKRQYIKEGMKIAEVQKGILLTSQNTKPYDIFLCYKETDENGNRTRDSILAQEIYYRLIEQGRSVFFSRITLEDVPGTAYEPYIFAALNSAKVMIVVGTSADYLNAPWVKNEWSRFLTLMKKDRSKLMIPCYRDMDPYDLPEQLGVLQSFDMGKIGFLQDLTHGISKVLDSKQSQKEKIVVQQATANPVTLMKRVFFFLEDGDWKTADEYCEKVLDIDPENADAYFGKLMAEYKISREADLEHIDAACVNSANFQKALRFGDRSMQEKLEGIRKDTVYYAAKKLAQQKTSREQQKANFREAVSILQTIPGWRDSDSQVEEYQNQLRQIQEQEEAQRQERQRRKQLKREKLEAVSKKQNNKPNQGKPHTFLKKLIVGVLFVVIILELLILGGLVPSLFRKKAAVMPQESEKIQISETILKETQPVVEELSAEELQYQQAEAWEADGQLGRAAIAFGKLGDYSDARDRSFSIWQRITPRKTRIKSNAMAKTENDILDISGGYALLSDGSMMLYDDYRYARYTEKWDLSGWVDIVGIDSALCTYEAHPTPNSWYSDNDYYWIGLKLDGTVIATGDNADGQCDVSDWSDIVSITTVSYELTNVGTPIGDRRSTSDHYTVGLKYDGSIVIAGKIPENLVLSDWTDIVKISASADHLAGLRSDGTVVSTYYNQSQVSDWNNITDIDAGLYHLIGLKSDGTVKAVGNNYAYKHLEVEDWTDIVAISASDQYTVGLKSDGTVMAVGNYSFDLNSYFDDLNIPEKTLPARNGNETKMEEVLADQQAQYDAAEKLLADGETAKAAIAFGKLGDYSDARQRSLALWDKIAVRSTLSATRSSGGDNPVDETFAVREDGTVVMAGSTKGMGDQATTGFGWTDIIATDEYLGLKADGTVVTIDGAPAFSRPYALEWKDIVSVSGGFGLKLDGTVMPNCSYPISEETQNAVSQWQDIIAVSNGEPIVGLKSDGTVIHAGNYDSFLTEADGYDVSDWKDIVAVSSSNGFTVGLKSDGTVVATGINSYGQCSVSDWTDIIAISTGNRHTVGLKRDGTVVVTGGNRDGGCNVSNWTDIVAIDTGSFYTVGLKSDGTAVAVGNNTYGQCDIAGWTDIKLSN